MDILITKKDKILQIIASSLLLFGALIFFVEIFTPIRVYAPIYGLFIDPNIPNYKYAVYLIVNIYIIALFLLAVITFVLTLLNHKHAVKMLYITLLTFALMLTMLTISQIVYSVSEYQNLSSDTYYMNYLNIYIWPININNALISVSFIASCLIISIFLNAGFKLKNIHLYRFLSCLPAIIFILPTVLQLMCFIFSSSEYVFADILLTLAIYAFFMTWLAFYRFFSLSKKIFKQTFKITLSLVCLLLLVLAWITIYFGLLEIIAFCDFLSLDFVFILFLFILPFIVVSSFLALSLYANAFLIDIANQILFGTDTQYCIKFL